MFVLGGFIGDRTSAMSKGGWALRCADWSFEHVCDTGAGPIGTPFSDERKVALKRLGR
ncbi:hypothetical protein FRC20_009492, partial [Serendipita sp. 405]